MRNDAYIGLAYAQSQGCAVLQGVGVGIPEGLTRPDDGNNLAVDGIVGQKTWDKLLKG